MQFSDDGFDGVPLKKEALVAQLSRFDGLHVSNAAVAQDLHAGSRAPQQEVVVSDRELVCRVVPQTQDPTCVLPVPQTLLGPAALPVPTLRSDRR